MNRDDVKALRPTLLFCSLKFVIALAFFVTIPSGQARSAYSDKVNRIFDKRQRTLDAPPRSLRADRKPSTPAASPRFPAADSEPGSTVMASGKEVPSGPSDGGTVNPATALPAPPRNIETESRMEKLDFQPVAPLGRPRPVPQTSYMERNRSAIRSDKLSSVAFSGERVFGIGFVGGAQYGVFGAEIDFKVDESWSAGFGWGTGMSYSTWGLHARRYLHRGTFSTFMKFGYANWHLGQVPRDGENVSPQFLVKRFLGVDGNLVLNKTAHLVYPSIGIDYQHESGIAFHALLQYLVGVSDFSGALYAGAGFFYYF